MNKIIVILVFAILPVGIIAQTKDKNLAMTRKEKRNEETEKTYQLNKYMVENRDFVLEADRLQDRYGNLANVSSTINFVAVDSATAIIQIGSNLRFGPNGVGGVTAKGKISNWKLVEHQKQKSFSLSFNVMTSIGIYDLYFMITPSNSSTVRLTSLRAGELTFIGSMVPYSESGVFEGQSL
jgi:hypothetical protein